MVPTRYKLIVLDLDGTLLDAEQKITARTRLVLERAQADGVAVAVATGRSYALTRYFVDGLPLNGPQITYNGAIIADPVSGVPLFARHIPPALVAPVLTFLAEQEVYVSYYTDDTIYVTGRSDLEIALVPPGMPEPARVPSFDAVTHLPALKLVAVAENDRISALRPLAEEAFGAKLYVTRTHAVLLEFLHASVSKGAALQWVMESLGLERDQVIAFGDSHNDIELLRMAGTGVAMGNADAEVRAASDLVAPPNTEDGVARVLEDRLWV
jgi:Cof subfamily protein (haloacid dehalogenase superfamily)